MSRLTGLAITSLAIYLAVNSLPDNSSRDAHVAAVAIATDNREGIARDLGNISAPAKSFSANNPLLASTNLAKANVTPQSAKAPVKTLTSSAGRVSQKLNSENIELASTDTYADIKPVFLKRTLISPPTADQILRDTQRELKRIGCYRSRIDGIWGRGSKWALSQFIKRTDKLPRNLKASFTDNPNKVLLEVLRKTNNRICGRPCASGKMLSSNGRCINDPVIMASVASTASWTASVSPDPTSGTNAKLANGTDRKILQRAVTHRAKAKKVKRIHRARKIRKASKKWRKRRYALGGPKYRRHAKRRHVKRRRIIGYRVVRRYKRRSSWKRHILSPDY